MSQFRFPHQFGPGLDSGQGAPPWDADPDSMPPADDEPHPLYSEKERRIFGPYDRDGTGRGVYADPVRVKRRLTAALDGDPHSAVARTRSEQAQVASEATDRLVPAVCYALDLQYLDPETGAGLCEDEVISVLNAFFEFEEGLKKNAVTSPGSPDSGPGSSPDGPRTGCTAGCGCGPR